MMTDKERIREHLEEFPEESDSQVARYLGVHRKTVWSVRQSMKAEKPAEIFVDLVAGRHRVFVNGREWNSFSSRHAAEAEAEFLRWPKEPAA